METKKIRATSKNKMYFINNLIDKLNKKEISKLQYLKISVNQFKTRS
jgi:hypothetical protein